MDICKTNILKTSFQYESQIMSRCPLRKDLETPTCCVCCDLSGDLGQTEEMKHKDNRELDRQTEPLSAEWMLITAEKESKMLHGCASDTYFSVMALSLFIRVLLNFLRNIDSLMLEA